MAPTGSPETRLVVLRGNSGSGKSSTARALRERLGRGTAWVEQDHLRRVLLREHDVPGGLNIDLIALNVRFALDHGYTVILEGILHRERYAEMLESLHAEHLGSSFFYYFDIPFEETLRRHATRPQADSFGADEMREWYQDRDLLDGVRESILGPHAKQAATVARILADLGHVPPP